MYLHCLMFQFYLISPNADTHIAVTLCIGGSPSTRERSPYNATKHDLTYIL